MIYRLHGFAARVVALSAGACVSLGGTDAIAAEPEIAWGTTISAAAGTRAELFGVSAAAADSVWAVGGFNPGLPPTAVLTRPYAEHWDGASWTATPVPLPTLYSSQSAQLQGVSSAAPTDVWAVGHVDDIASLASRNLAYRWDGISWTEVPTPNPGGASLGNRLFAVTARASNDAWAVGESGFPGRSLVLRWDGAAWSALKLPNVGRLVAVTADTGNVWAASVSTVLRFNGTRWIRLPAPPVSNSSASLLLSGIARSGNQLWAVGTLLIPYGEGYLTQPYAAIWQASAWTQITAVPTQAGLTAVSASNGTVRATSGAGEVLRLRTGGADREVTPVPGAVGLAAISGDASGHVWAVGTLYATTSPAIFNAPGIGQGGVRVSTRFSGASVTWIGPVNGSGTADAFGLFSVGGLPAGSYQIIASGSICSPGVSGALVSEGAVTSVDAPVHC